MVYRPEVTDRECAGDSYVLLNEGGPLVPMCRTARALPAVEIPAQTEQQSSTAIGFDLSTLPEWVKWAVIGLGAYLLLKR